MKIKMEMLAPRHMLTRNLVNSFELSLVVDLWAYCWLNAWKAHNNVGSKKKLIN